MIAKRRDFKLFTRFSALLAAVMFCYLPHLTFAGWISVDQATDTGVFVSDKVDGRRYQGPYNNGRGGGGEAVIEWPSGMRWIGQTKSVNPDGLGTMTWPDGKVFVGEFRNSEMVKGTTKLPNGDSYEGSYSSGLKDGFGTYRWSDGTYYKGDFKQNVLTGEATITYKNGDSYSGGVLDGKPHGYGVKVYKSGESRSGMWENGKLIKETPNTVFGNPSNSNTINSNAGFAALKDPLTVQVEVGTRFPYVKLLSKLPNKPIWGEYVLVNCVNVSDHCQSVRVSGPFSMSSIYSGIDIYPNDYCKPYSFQVEVRWVFDGMMEKGKIPRFQGITRGTPFGPFLSTFKDDCPTTNNSTAAVTTVSTAKENKPQPPIASPVKVPAPEPQGNKAATPSNSSSNAEAPTCNTNVGKVVITTKADYVKSMGACRKAGVTDTDWGSEGDGHGTPEESCKNVLQRHRSSSMTACYCFKSSGEGNALNEGDWVCWVGLH